MSQPLFEKLTGTVDGVNDTFFFSKPYTAGTVALYLNGQLLFSTAAGGNPWTESSPSTGEVTIAADCLPIVQSTEGDVVSGFALDTTAEGPETVIEEINATINDAPDRLAGQIEDVPTQLNGAVSDVTNIVGVIDDVDILQATVTDIDRIAASVESC